MTTPSPSPASSVVAAPSKSAKDLQIQFLDALMAFEADEVSLANATLIRDNTAAMILTLREGLNASLAFEIQGLEDITPLSLAAQTLSNMAFHMKRITGKSLGAVPSFSESQSQHAAADALRQIVVQTLDSAQVLRCTRDAAGDAMQSLDALCAPGDAELIERCVDANLILTPAFVQRMDLDTIHQTLARDGAFKAAFISLMTDPATSAAMSAAINRAGALADCNESTLKDMSPILRSALTPVTIDTALRLCVTDYRVRKETVQGLLAMGANPLGSASVDPTQPSLLWLALKDSNGVGAAEVLALLTPNLNESHGGQSLLARAVSRRSDDLNAQLAVAGARFLNKEEAVFALVEAAEQRLHKTIDIALQQGADVNDIESSGMERTALICAGLFDDGVAVKILLEKGAKPELVVSKSKMLMGEGYTRIRTHFIEEAVRIDAVKALHAAAVHLGLQCLDGLDVNDRCPKVKKMLELVKTNGSLPALSDFLEPHELDPTDPMHPSQPGGMAAAAMAQAAVDAGSGMTPGLSQADQAAINVMAPGLGDLLGSLQKQGTQIVQVGPGGGTIRF